MRLTALLILLTLASALGVVALQHQSRNFVTAIEREQVRTRALEVEWGQLQLESSTWATHARVEKIARDRLGMVTPTKDSLVSVDPVNYSRGIQKQAAPPAIEKVPARKVPQR